MPGPIRCVTIATPNLAETQAAWTDFLNYRVVASDAVSAEQSATWDAPAMQGRAQVLMTPEQVSDRYVRLVDIDPVEGYAPLRTLGWNAIEIIVRDTDAMADRLEDSPFSIVGPPEDLSFSDAIRAMQATGPGGEMVYLTMSKRKIEAFDLPEVSGDVGQPFIVISGGDLAALQSFYGETMLLPDAPVFEGRISVLSSAYGLPSDRPHRLAAMPLGGTYYIELDQYPDAAVPRRGNSGQLPPGQSMVTFEVDSLSNYEVAWRSEPTVGSGPLYGDRAHAVAVGPAGEWIELVER